MSRFFNIAGPCIPGEHYMIPAGRRCGDLWELVDRKTYFVIHAARQTGKTTLVLDLVGELNRSNRYHGLYCPLEVVQPITDWREGIRAIFNRFRFAVSSHPVLGQNPPVTPDTTEDSLLLAYFSQLAGTADKPVVILFDEADCLAGNLLISFLRQLRDGYVNRSVSPFIHSVALVGMRNLRDYKARIRPNGDTLGSVSPFNIITKALTIRNFTRDEIAELFAQHTADTGQAFPPEVVDAVWRETAGQPWLVNAIAREIVDEILERDSSRPITLEHVQQARDTIILRRDTHIDSLMERLREPRVQRIIEPMITGEAGDMDALADDYQYVHDLGLITTEDGVTKPANPIYGEVILRMLNYRTQFRLAEEQRPYLLPRYVAGDGLDMRRLLGEFQEFWRENSEIWSEVYTYKEAAPHLILLAFLQRVVNQKATLAREFAAGRGRIDVCIHYKDKKYPIEIKVLKGPGTIEKGFEQLAHYMDRMGTDEGWLLVFNRDETIPWEKKITWETHRRGARTIHLVGA